jgi:DNA processing protein
MDLILWIWLSLSCTPGSQSFRKLYEKFGNVNDIYSAESSEISSSIGSRSSDYKALLDKNLEKAESVLDFCRKKNVGILTYSDAKFPSALRKISNPPVLLYYRGVLPDFENSLCISVVGTRSISDYGRRNAFFVSRDLAKTGAVIVSGMAIGIDGVALAGALSESAVTVAVIGSGIDVCYPSQHKRLAREIVKRGCVFTEYAPGTRPDGRNFPCRNRIISGLSEATVVIEGKERSGALITARCAKEQGRRVYALPGNVGNKNSELTNLLIKSGARSFTSADDIVKDFENRVPAVLNPFKLLEPSSRDMFSVLSEYEVAAVSPSDSIFKHSVRKKNIKEETNKKEEPSAMQAKSREAEISSFDKKTLALYKKIPLGEEISIESLVDSDTSLRDVMRLLLKLEMSRFVTMLPGEKVKRNI